MTAARTGIERFGVVGFNHRQIPARLRGALSFDDAWCTELATRLKEAHLADGVAFVSTCNRQEVVLSADHPAFAVELVRAQLHSRLADAGAKDVPEPFRFVGEEAVRHVLRVSASLDSLVVGERQITQQLRRSFDQARRAGWMDKPLNGLARISVENAKEIHSRTSIGAQVVGVFTLARDLVFRELAGLEKPKVAVVGLGEIGLKTARAIAAEHRCELTLSSRKPRTAGELGTTLENCPFVPMDRLPELLESMDAIVLATGAPTPVVDFELLDRSRLHAKKPLILVDIGIPPQADTLCDGTAETKLFNLDWFTSTGFGQKPQAKEALRQANDIVEEGVREVAAWTSVRRFSNLFDSLVTLAEERKQRGIPDTLKEELSVLSVEHQRLVANAMHRLLTEYAEGVFETVTRELVEHTQDLSRADAAAAQRATERPGSSTGADDERTTDHR